MVARLPLIWLPSFLGTDCLDLCAAVYSGKMTHEDKETDLICQYWSKHTIRPVPDWKKNHHPFLFFFFSDNTAFDVMFSSSYDWCPILVS